MAGMYEVQRCFDRALAYSLVVIPLNIRTDRCRSEYALNRLWGTVLRIHSPRGFDQSNRSSTVLRTSRSSGTLHTNRIRRIVEIPMLAGRTYSDPTSLPGQPSVRLDTLHRHSIRTRIDRNAGQTTSAMMIGETQLPFAASVFDACVSGSYVGSADPPDTVASHMCIYRFHRTPRSNSLNHKVSNRVRDSRSPDDHDGHSPQGMPGKENPNQ